MPLTAVLDKPRLTILGLNSGTSADGVDLAVIRVTRKNRSVKFIAGRSHAYPPAIRDAVLTLADGHTTSLEQVIQIDALLGQYFGKVASAYLRRLAGRGIHVDAVASHGQTVRHLPQKSRLAGTSVHGTLQLGSIAQIAALTRKVTVGDFRQADIALGNEGAPITVAAVARLFGHPRQSRIILNVGGMANFFYIPPGGDLSKVQAADTGPGNVLSDLLSRELYREKYDHDGRHARTGVCSARLLALVTSLPFFRGRTVSTGRELFGGELAAKLAREGKKLRLKPADILSTAVEITAFGVAHKLAPITARDKSIRKLYLTGGGSFNSFLVERIAARLPGVEVGTVSELGMDPSLTEASSYAVMGAACLWSEPLPTRFGSMKQRPLPILGVIAQPPV